MVRVRVRGWVTHYFYKSPSQIKYVVSTRICVCVVCVCVWTNTKERTGIEVGEDQNTFIVDMLRLFHKNLEGQKIQGKREWLKKSKKMTHSVRTRQLLARRCNVLFFFWKRSNILKIFAVAQKDKRWSRFGGKQEWNPQVPRSKENDRRLTWIRLKTATVP